MRREDDFASTVVQEHWSSFDIDVPTVHRSLEAAIGPFLDAGFVLESLVAAKADERAASQWPADKTRKLARRPGFSCLGWLRRP